MPVAPTGANPSQLDTSQFHPEFGYFAPTIRFRRQVVLTLKGALWGTLVGAVVMFFMGVEREEKGLRMLAVPMLSGPSDGATVGQRSPVPFVRESIALPAIVSAPAPARGDVAPAATPAVTSGPGTAELPATIAPPDIPAMPVVTSPAVTPSAAIPAATVAVPVPIVAASAPEPEIVAPTPPVTTHARTVAKPIAKRKKRVIREPERAEPDRRTAFAAPFRRYGEPYGPGSGRPFFGGFGW
jgi:hypothetical protein